jgi:hypothetical protein
VTYLDYAYTASGTTVTLTAPAQPGNYEVSYASDRVAGIFASIPMSSSNKRRDDGMWA